MATCTITKWGPFTELSKRDTRRRSSEHVPGSWGPATEKERKITSALQWQNIEQNCVGSHVLTHFSKIYTRSILDHTVLCTLNLKYKKYTGSEADPTTLVSSGSPVSMIQRLGYRQVDVAQCSTILACDDCGPPCANDAFWPFGFLLCFLTVCLCFWGIRKGNLPVRLKKKKKNSGTDPRSFGKKFRWNSGICSVTLRVTVFWHDKVSAWK